MMILDLLGIGFHSVVVFGLGKDLLFKSVLGHCGKYLNWLQFQNLKVYKFPETICGNTVTKAYLRCEIMSIVETKAAEIGLYFVFITFKE